MVLAAVMAAMIMTTIETTIMSTAMLQIASQPSLDAHDALASEAARGHRRLAVCLVCDAKPDQQPGYEHAARSGPIAASFPFPGAF